MEMECDDKKYTWVFGEKTGRLSCLRYGQEWRDETGDGAILALLQECDELKAENRKLRQALHRACDNWTESCYSECRALNCMHVDVCEGVKK